MVIEWWQIILGFLGWVILAFALIYWLSYLKGINAIVELRRIPDAGNLDIGSPVFINGDLYVVDMYHDRKGAQGLPRYVLIYVPRKEWKDHGVSRDGTQLAGKSSS